MKFVSKVSNHVLCMKPARIQIQDGIAVPIPGEHIRFNNHEYDTKDKKEQNFIKNHRLFGSQITVVEEAGEK